MVSSFLVTFPYRSFKRVANIPDDIELFLADHGLQSHAPVIRTYVAFGDDQLQSFSKLSPDLLHAAVDTSAPMIKRSLCRIQKLLKAACEAQVHMNELLTKQPGKFSIFKASGGTIDAFHKGLLHRIGTKLHRFPQHKPSYNFFATSRIPQAPPASILKKPCALSIAQETAASTRSLRQTTASPLSLVANGSTLSETTRANGQAAPT